jgi:hypothetical protein
MIHSLDVLPLLMPNAILMLIMHASSGVIKPQPKRVGRLRLPTRTMSERTNENSDWQKSREPGLSTQYRCCISSYVVWCVVPSSAPSLAKKTSAPVHFYCEFPSEPRAPEGARGAAKTEQDGANGKHQW